jgi:hypothetical protein
VSSTASVEVRETDVHVSATVGVTGGALHPRTNSMRKARPMMGNDFLLSILVSVLYEDSFQPRVTVAGLQ